MNLIIYSDRIKGKVFIYTESIVALTLIYNTRNSGTFTLYSLDLSNSFNKL